MTDKSCKDCVYYKEGEGNTMGQCKYPLPPFVLVQCAAGYIYTRDAIDCPLYKSLTDVMDAAKHKPNVPKGGSDG